MKNIILMSTYNGEKYLEAQLNSLISQTVHVDILVRDDGSSDSTKEILNSYQERGLLSWYEGGNLGCGKSFWHLLNNCQAADYYFFCDQDDVWDNNKVEVAITALEKNKADSLLLYCSYYRLVDAELNILTDKTDEITHLLNYKSSLIYSLAPGCTFAFNDSARTLLKRYPLDNILIHDWDAHKIIACFGKIIYDCEPRISYRQHGNNVVGVERKVFKKYTQKFKRFIHSNNCRSITAQNLFNTFGDEMEQSNKDFTFNLANYRKNKKAKKQLLHEKTIDFRNNKNFIFKMLVRLEKI